MRSWARMQTPAWTLKPATDAQHRPDGRASASTTASPAFAAHQPARGPVVMRPKTKPP